MAEKTLVLKAGGVVVGTMKFLTALAGIIGRYRAAGDRAVLTVSAPDKVTDLLTKVARNIGAQDVGQHLDAVMARYRKWLADLGLENRFDELLGVDFTVLREMASRATAPSPEMKDAILAFGEMTSIKVVAAFLETNGTAAEAYDASSGGMITNDAFGNAEPLPEARRALRNDLESILLRERVAVVSGFIGHTKDGRCITTLGRGGSDYTATFVAEAIRADRIEIWKETPLRRTDPRLVPSTPPIASLTYEQASEAAAAGMKAVHPRAIGPAHRAGIVMWVRDINFPDQLGTRIGASVVSAIAVVRKTCWVSLASEDMCDTPGFLSRASGVFSQHNLDIDVAATGAVRVSFTVDDTDREASFAEAMQELQTFAVVVVRNGSAVLSVVAPAIGPHLIGEIGDALASARIALRGISMAGSVDGDAIAPQSCQFVIADSDVEVAVRTLHAAFFEL